MLVSGLLAAVSAVMLTARNPQVTPIFALDDTIVVLAGVVLGGALPTNQSQYLPTFLFAAVILVLLVRPNGLFARGGGAAERL